VSPADRIIEAAAVHFGVRPCDIIGPGREKTKIRMRHIAACIIRERLDMSYPEISKALGCRDHTTAMNAVRRARHHREVNPMWADDFNGILKLLLDWREEREIERLEVGA